MKKRYLSMLMAVVLCLGLFTTGALAASGEIETAASEEITEPVADGQPSETPAESAEPGETPQTQALDGESASVPVPMALSSDGEGNANPSTISVTTSTVEGYVIAGYGGTVTYGDLPSSSAPTNTPFENCFEWKGTNTSAISGNATPSATRYEDKSRSTYKNVKISVTSDASVADKYEFKIMNHPQFIYTGTLVVLSLATARNTAEYPDVVKYEGFDLYKYTGTAASPMPLEDAVFGLYTSDPSIEGATPSPVATFTTDENGTATIKLDENTAENVLPKLGDPTKSGTAKGRHELLPEGDHGTGWVRAVGYRVVRFRLCRMGEGQQQSRRDHQPEIRSGASNGQCLE